MINLKKVLIIIVIGVAVTLCEARKNKKLKQSISLGQKETNAIDFIRLVVMRLIYGVAKRLGFGENISEALNGAFVPPGVDEYDDYGDFDLLDRDDYK